MQHLSHIVCLNSFPHKMNSRAIMRFPTAVLRRFLCRHRENKKRNSIRFNARREDLNVRADERNARRPGNFRP